MNYAMAFLVGVVLFWSFGRTWLDLESIRSILAGIIGVALSVLSFGAWNIYDNSRHKES
jgi:4-amino-4-deoxy-L-arabinose transferase-like glycosyltransferase